MGKASALFANFSNARLIWSNSRGFSHLKLLAAQASMTRPELRPFCLTFLNMVSRSGMFWAWYSTSDGTLRASFRLS